MSLTELMMGIVISAILFIGISQMLSATNKSAKRTSDAGAMSSSMARFVELMKDDLSRAGSDPVGDTLQGYIYEAICAGKLIFKYGINPEPADPTCVTRLGDIGILSYVAYDANNDGSVDPEEGIDLAGTPPTMRTIPSDYVVYELRGDRIYRKNLGDPDSNADDSEDLALENVAQFQIVYHGYDEDGIYGQITDNSRYDDIREVEVSISLHAPSAEPGYTNPSLPPGHPYSSYRTESRTFRVPLIVRKE